MPLDPSFWIEPEPKLKPQPEPEVEPEKDPLSPKGQKLKDAILKNLRKKAKGPSFSSFGIPGGMGNTDFRNLINLDGPGVTLPPRMGPLIRGVEGHGKTFMPIIGIDPVNMTTIALDAESTFMPSRGYLNDKPILIKRLPNERPVDLEALLEDQYDFKDMYHRVRALAEEDEGRMALALIETPHLLALKKED